MAPARLDALIWTLVYAGLFIAIVGFAALSAAPIAAWLMLAGGGLMAVVGFALIPVRARQTPPPGAQSEERTRDPER